MAPEPDPPTEIEALDTPGVAVRLAERQPYDLIMGDYDLPEVDGLELPEQIVATRYQIPALTVTGQGGEEAAVLATMALAYDHIVKSADYPRRLATVVEGARCGSRGTGTGNGGHPSSS
ncbi:MAG: hypothetical protein CEE40_01880 [Chloroflexi bacterium B3_Chlor]|nr:MAG: hypothetical protein CEE40_01880 [Chloroflexi bacterium B3_Chlor]